MPALICLEMYKSKAVWFVVNETSRYIMAIQSLRSSLILARTERRQLKVGHPNSGKE